MADNYTKREGTGKLTLIRSVELEGGIHIPIYALADAEGNLLGTTSAPVPVTIVNGITLGDITLENVTIGNTSANPVPVSLETFDAATLTNLAASTDSQTLLAANADRKFMAIHNDSTATLYLKFGNTASNTSYTYSILGGDTYESPPGLVYTGRIDGSWSHANGTARVTEGT